MSKLLIYNCKGFSTHLAVFHKLISFLSLSRIYINITCTCMTYLQRQCKEPIYTEKKFKLKIASTFFTVQKIHTLRPYQLNTKEINT